MRFLFQHFCKIGCCILLVFNSHKSLGESLSLSSEEQLRLVGSLIETICITNACNRSIVAMVNKSVKVDPKGFKEEVFGGGSRGSVALDAASIQIRSNIFAFMLSGNQWKMTREVSDHCLQLGDLTFYSTTNLAELSPPELDRLKEVYWDRSAYDPTSRYGYQTANYGPYQSSVITGAQGSPLASYYLNLARSIEHEITFMILVSLGQTNIVAKKLCNPLIYDFNGLKYDLKAAKTALDSGQLKMAKTANGPGVDITLKTPFDTLVRVRYDQKSRLPFGMIEVEENGVTLRRITRNMINGKPWSLEWFDEQFNSNSEQTGFKRIYILSETEVNAEDLFASFDAEQKKSRMKSHKKADGSYTDSVNGLVTERTASSVDTTVFFRSYGRFGVLLGFVAISLVFCWMLLRKR